MRKTLISKFYITIFIAGAVLISCNKEQNLEPTLSNNTECNDPLIKHIGNGVESTSFLSKTEITELKNCTISQKKNSNLDFSQSVRVSYKNMTAYAIFTPVISTKSKEKTFLVNYVNGSIDPDNAILLSEMQTDNANTVYSYLTLEGEFICSFNVNAEGILSEFKFNVSKAGIPKGYGNCVGKAIEGISREPIVALTCMGFGLYCAGFIGFMCLAAI
ncbi:hypothetical protein DSECCO2_212810 [anaerobic digester metagenome]